MGLFDALGGALDLIGGIAGPYTQNKATNSYVDALKQAEDYKYNQAKANYEAYKDWVGKKAEAAKAAAAGAAAAARTRAGLAMSEDKLRRKAGKKAKRILKKSKAESLGFLSPFLESGTAMLPAQQAAFSQGLENLNALQAYTFTPQAMNFLKPQGSVFARDIFPSLVEKGDIDPNAKIETAIGKVGAGDGRGIIRGGPTTTEDPWGVRNLK